MPIDIPLTSWAFRKALYDLTDQPCPLEEAILEAEKATIQ